MAERSKTRNVSIRLSGDKKERLNSIIGEERIKLQNLLEDYIDAVIELYEEEGNLNKIRQARAVTELLTK